MASQKLDPIRQFIRPLIPGGQDPFAMFDRLRTGEQARAAQFEATAPRMDPVKRIGALKQARRSLLGGRY